MWLSDFLFKDRRNLLQEMFSFSQYNTTILSYAGQCLVKLYMHGHIQHGCQGIIIFQLYVQSAYQSLKSKHLICIHMSYFHRPRHKCANDIPMVCTLSRGVPRIFGKGFPL